jgi:hypothetical protein
MSGQHLLNELNVRLISNSERSDYDALLDKEHYLKSGHPVGERL